MEKRTLIAEDQEMLQDIIQDINKFQPALLNLKSAYSELDLGDLTNEVYKQVVIQGADKLLETFFTSVNNELDNAGLKKESLRKPHLDNATKTFNAFLASITALKKVDVDPYRHSRRPVLKFTDISFIDGEFIVSAMDKENIMEENCRIYLEGEMEHLLYDKLKTVRDSINNLYSYLNDVALKHDLTGLDAISMHTTLSSLGSIHEFLSDGEVIEIKPYSIRWITEMLQRAVIEHEKQTARAALPRRVSLPMDTESILARNKAAKIQERSDLKKANRLT